ncbi:oligosaccharide flippase family protein [Arthrobacter oryzae]|uniref:oligosaccharide flippase family protein n=1 Tax=Arthrobacter oryzae TaxID=409290 RepID=UPI00278A2E67|nr:oligosaccharide flippase family protein [Arthrobacter oryzae]MDQ0078490.1 O-antigen/teichoic acid export membrane protein [Arthrobacter oryzae]
MRDFLRLVRKFGWLPASQACVFILSTSGFAVLAHILGPTEFARFATVILLFSVSALVTDLSPQSYTLVHGPTADVIKTARRLATISGLLGVSFMSFAVLAAASLIPGGPLSAIEFAFLVIALIAQIGMQVQRAVLVSKARFGAIALSDVGSTLVGIAMALILAVSPFEELALAGQLGATAVAKVLGIWLASREIAQPPQTDNARRLWPAVRYGLRVVPLNIASYLGRALDSGILPSLVPAAAAAGYARSYQIAVVPITQLQLSLGPAILNHLSNAKRENLTDREPPNKALWMWMSRIIFISALSICASAMVIEVVIFGPKWPMVHVTIVAMASCLPGIAMASYGSLTLQLNGGRRRTVAHFCTVVGTPIAVILAAALGSFAEAVSTLVVVGGLVQPLLLSLVHNKEFSAPIKTAVTVAGQWFALAAIFYFVAQSSSFWTTTY